MPAHRSDSFRLSMPGGHALQVQISAPGQPCDPALIYVHGFGSTRAGQKALALEEACVRRGWTFVSFDFRGHGESSGSLLNLRGSSLLEDLEAVHDCLRNQGILRICPVGSSMGGWTSTWFALRRPQSVPTCVLIAPALDFLVSRWARATESEREQWKRTGRLRVRNAWVDEEIGYGIVEEIDQFPVQKLAEELTTPLLIFHGMKDDVVPYQQSISLAERAMQSKIELRLFNGGDHRLLDYATEMAESACDFVAKALTLPPANRGE
jgi:pimeloyl-ACP methyl ester carboxylesterase